MNSQLEYGKLGSIVKVLPTLDDPAFAKTAVARKLTATKQANISTDMMSFDTAVSSLKPIPPTHVAETTGTSIGSICDSAQASKSRSNALEEQLFASKPVDIDFLSSVSLMASNAAAPAPPVVPDLLLSAPVISQPLVQQQQEQQPVTQEPTPDLNKSELSPRSVDAQRLQLLLEKERADRQKYLQDLERKRLADADAARKRDEAEKAEQAKLKAEHDRIKAAQLAYAQQQAMQQAMYAQQQAALAAQQQAYMQWQVMQAQQQEAQLQAAAAAAAWNRQQSDAEDEARRQAALARARAQAAPIEWHLSDFDPVQRTRELSPIPMDNPSPPSPPAHSDVVEADVWDPYSHAKEEDNWEFTEGSGRRHFKPTFRYRKQRDDMGSN
eukprot:TRINITY_DN13561_c0_g1_i1.p1 TRINITY_DN13561_c0_g1~~TRINITY_DN13561_c0_g1_i1.p1  ORF type:complete len:383 (+),score=119.05 TRINITY_DN13561_c0_g1_i1:198-1346(+)